MMWTINRSSPGFTVAAITAAPRLLSDEKAYIVISVISGVKAP